MNIIKNVLTITAYTVLLTAGQTVQADSAEEFHMVIPTEVFGSPAIGPASTPNFIESTRATVFFADLNLENKEDVRVAYRLLQRASKEVCGGGKVQHGRSVIMKSSRLRCYRKSLANAVNNIDNENLTRLHAG